MKKTQYSVKKYQTKRVQTKQKCESEMACTQGKFLVAEGTADELELRTQQVPVSVEIVKGLERFIPKDVRASSGFVSEDMKAYERQGLFNPTIGMGQIFGRCQDKLYAYISKDCDNRREIRFVEEYADGSYSPEFVIRQSDLLDTVSWLKWKDPLMEKECRRSLRRIKDDYLNKCCGQEAQNITEVIIALAEGLHKLPVKSENGELTRVQLYEEVLTIIKECFPQILKYYRREGYIILTEDYLAGIAEKMSMSVRKILEELKKNGLLYLTDSCRGYQARVPSHREAGKVIYDWSYCLLDMEYYARKLDPAKADSAKELATSFIEEVNPTNF